jgi:acyl-CoA reductase-like NAD-dependent aldehyde dehydrogenase
VLLKWADLIERHADELGVMDTLEMGMPIGSSVPGVVGSANTVRTLAELADKVDSSVVPSASSNLTLSLYVPHGVVASITPWNFPVHMGVSKVVPALAMGNCVVLKPSEIAPLSCLRLADLATQAGMPDGVLNVIPGLGTGAGRLLALHPDVNCLSFTGSTATGQLIMQYAGQSNLKRLILECGGKSPQIVCDDCGDLNAIAKSIVQGFVWNSGQVCFLTPRILIHDSLVQEIVPLLIQYVRETRTGTPLDPATKLGPLASRKQFDRVRRFIANAEQSGSKPIAIGSIPESTTGFHVAPVLFSDVISEQELMQEEIFGPVAGIMPFKDIDEAVALANSTKYGLAAKVWTSNLQTARRMAREIQAGWVNINAVAQPMPHMAMGASMEPVGMSGFGVGGGIGGMRSFTRVRGVLFNCV